MLNWKRYLIAAIVVFLVYSIADTVIRTVLLARDYWQEDVARLLRPETEIWKRRPAGEFANLILALAFCFIYTKGLEVGKNWLGQGIRYGLLVGSLVSLPAALLQYMVYPLPLLLALKWIVLGYGQMMICGIAVAAIYRLPSSLPRPPSG